MARLMKYQMDHAIQKLDKLIFETLGYPPARVETDRYDEDKFTAQISKGEAKITPAIIKRACQRYQNIEMKKRSWDRATIMWLLYREVNGKELDAVEKKHADTRKKYDDRQAKMYEAKGNAIDQIILGGEEGALAAIKEFGRIIKKL